MSRCLRRVAVASGRLARDGRGRIGGPEGARGKPTPAEAAKHLGIGRKAKSDEFAGWDIDTVRTAQGLPWQGHGQAGRTALRRAMRRLPRRVRRERRSLADPLRGRGTLAGDDPVKSIGSYWPDASSATDYIRAPCRLATRSRWQRRTVRGHGDVLYLNDIYQGRKFRAEASHSTRSSFRTSRTSAMTIASVAEKALWRKSRLADELPPRRSRGSPVAPGSST